MKRLSYIIVASVAIYIGCDAINPFSPKITHTMDEIITEISRDIDYEGQTVTTKATIEAVKRETANEDRLDLVTNHSDVFFYILADRDKYRVGKTYTFTIYIEFVELNSGTLGRPSSTYITGRMIND